MFFVMKIKNPKKGNKKVKIIIHDLFQPNSLNVIESVMTIAKGVNISFLNMNFFKFYWLIQLIENQ